MFGNLKPILWPYNLLCNQVELIQQLHRGTQRRRQTKTCHPDHIVLTITETCEQLVKQFNVHQNLCLKSNNICVATVGSWTHSVFKWRLYSYKTTKILQLLNMLPYNRLNIKYIYFFFLKPTYFYFIGHVNVHVWLLKNILCAYISNSFCYAGHIHEQTNN